MRLTVVNASPRGRSGNTARVLSSFIEGLREGGLADVDLRYVRDLDSDQAARELFTGAEALLLAFPLYVYSLPSTALRFVSRLSPLAGSGGGKTLAFLCQYGFREGCHARPLEGQLERMTRTLGARYGGMLSRGGCEGLRSYPGFVARRILDGFRQMGRHFAENGLAFDPQRLREFSAPESAPRALRGRVGSLLWAKVANQFHWKPMLRRYRALAREADRPLPHE
jgi:multimeric flavodoxin WrbA